MSSRRTLLTLTLTACLAACSGAPAPQPVPTAPAAGAPPAPGPLSAAEREGILAQLLPVAQVAYVTLTAGKEPERRLSSMGGAIIGNNGANLVGTDGASLISDRGAGVVGNGGARLRLAQSDAISLEPAPGQPPPVWLTYADGTRAYRFEDREVVVSAEGRPLRELRLRAVSLHANGMRRVTEGRDQVLRYDDGGRATRVRDLTFEVARDDEGRAERLTIKTLELVEPLSGWRILGDALDLDLVAGTGRFAFRYPDLGFSEEGTVRGLPIRQLAELNYAEPLEGYAGESTVKDAGGRPMFRKVAASAGGPIAYELGDGLRIELRPAFGRILYLGALSRNGERLGLVALLRQEGGDNRPFGFSVTLGDTTYATAFEGGRLVFRPLPPPSSPAGSPAPLPQPELPGPYEPAAWWVGTSVTRPGPGAVIPSTGPYVTLLAPKGVAFDAAAEALYVVDQRANKLYRITRHDTRVLAGSGERATRDGVGAEAALAGPCGLALDAPRGRLIVTEQAGHAIRAVGFDGRVTTLAGAADGKPGHADGPAAVARFDEPLEVAVDAAGAVYVADYKNHRIRRIGVDGNVTTVAGDGEPGFRDGPGRQARFQFPVAVAFSPAGVLHVSDTGNHRIRRIDAAGNVATAWGSDLPGLADGPRFAMVGPGAIGFSAAGHLYMVNAVLATSYIRRIAPDGTSVTLAGSGEANSLDGLALRAGLLDVHSMTVTAAGDVLYFTEWSTGKVRFALPAVKPARRDAAPTP